MSDLKTYQFYIDGAWCDAEGGKTFESVDPSTGQPWALMPEASEADVDRAVEAADRAMWSAPWRDMLPPQRAALLRKLADLMAENARHLGEVETRDTGKIIRETAGQAAYIAEYYRYFAGLCDKIEGSTLPLDKPDMIAMTVREPLGVVAAIVPWNSQQFLIANKLGPAIAAGNTVVLKASEDGPAPIFEFAELVEEAGFPPGVVNVITGFGEPCGRTLTSHPKVARVAFTGGPDTARHVVRNTAENFAVTSLELGGKSPFIVFEDADIESATNGVVAGIFGASGQSCVAGSRLFLQDSIHDQVIENIVHKASHPHRRSPGWRYRVRPPVHHGPDREDRDQCGRHPQGRRRVASRRQPAPGLRRRLLLRADGDRMPEPRARHGRGGNVRPGAQRAAVFP